MSKQLRTYQEGAAARSAAAIAFLSRLRFSRPLQDLRDHPGRNKCPKCGKRKQYYCYDCLVVTNPEVHPQPCKLPLNVHVVLHPGESRSKATTLPIATVSPQVSIHTYPTVPELDTKTTLVLYPSPEAVEIGDITDADEITDVVFVDSTWSQSYCISHDERVKKYRHVKLSGIVSLFWRFQDKDPYHLATVEAVYHTVRRLVAARKRAAALKADPNAAPPAQPRLLGTAERDGDDGAAAAAEEQGLLERMMGAVPGLDSWYEGEADDLLFYYTNQYVIIQQSYQSGERVFTDKHFDGYVLKDADWDVLLKARAGDAQHRTIAMSAAAKKAAAPLEDQAARPQPPPSAGEEQGAQK